MGSTPNAAWACPPRPDAPRGELRGLLHAGADASHAAPWAVFSSARSPRFAVVGAFRDLRLRISVPPVCRIGQQPTWRSRWNVRPGWALRRLVESAVWLAVVLIFWRIWLLEGLPFRYVVASGSMAPSLLGPHRFAQCRDCGYGFVASDDAALPWAWVVCPNCGSRVGHAGELSRAPGDRILILRSTFCLRAPRRWEVVALRSPDRAGQVQVKRVVGLPGESIEIRHGDVYVDGHIARKTLDQQQALAVPVHDGRFVPPVASELARRWQPDSATTGWNEIPGGFSYQGEPTNASLDWLTYRHWRRRWQGEQWHIEEGPVLAETAHNLGRLQTPERLPPIHDLMLSFCAVVHSGDGSLAIRATGGKQRYEWRVVPCTGRFEAYCDGHRVASGLVPGGGGLPATWNLFVSLVDQQFLVAIDGRCVVAIPSPVVHDPPQPTSRPFAIGAMQLDLEVRDMVISRDAYYLPTPDALKTDRTDRPTVLEPNEYFVLGDNSPISVDSRSWGTIKGVPSEMLFGKPVLAIGHRVPAKVGPPASAIPHPAAIRYIR